jgi:hypothetical protein
MKLQRKYVEWIRFILFLFLDRINRIIRNFSPAARGLSAAGRLILTILLILSNYFLKHKNPFPLIQDQAIGNQLPEVFDLQVFKIIVTFDIFQLAVAAVARDHHHGGAGSLDLVHFPTAIINSLFVVAGRQGTAAAAAANLKLLGWIQIDPIFQALAQNPAGLLIVPMTEQLFRLTAVVAGIVIGSQNIISAFIDSDAFLFDIVNQKIKHGECADFLQ